MDLSSDFSVPATVNECWAAFNHVELIASCFGGFTLTMVDGHDFAGRLKVKLGTLPLVFAGQGRYLERHVGGRHTVIEATGTDERGKGTATVKIRTSFELAGDRTVVRIATEVDLTGQAGQFDSEVIRDAADRLVAQFRDAISIRFAEGLGAEALAADASATYASDLGSAASSRSATYTYNPPKVASQNDYEAIRAAAPGLVKRLAPALLAGVALLGLLRRVRRR